MDVVSFFAGCGGLDLGFEQAGFHIVWANEFNPECRDTYMLNHKFTKFVLGDINEIDINNIPNCDGFIGGPPCQSWSVAGKQLGLDDKRGQLFLKYINLIKSKKPKFFLIENVKGLLDSVFQNIFNMFINKLEDAGYNVKWELLDALNYGVPQNRERVFIIGFRKDLNIEYNFPKSTYPKPITLFQAIGDIKENPVEYLGKEQLMPNEHRYNHDVLASDFNQFYTRGNRRRGWQQPSFTIHATAENIPLHPSSPKMRFHGHENWEFQMDRISEYRRLSVRECARIQTFPDSFQFVTTNIKSAYKMIGNAVPPRLGKTLAKSIMAVLEQTKPCVKPVEIETSISNSCILVGYFKNNTQLRLIRHQLIYYVRSDGRPGSMFKDDCSELPKYLLLYHKDKYFFYELDGEEPVLTDGSYLKSLGFEVSGSTYLAFHLKDNFIRELGEPEYTKYSYTPYFTTIHSLIKKEL